MSKVSTNISLDSELKKSAQSLFRDLGLDLTTAVTLFLKQSIREQAIPFEIKREVPNAETIAAMNEFYEMQDHPEKYKRYSSFKAAMKDAIPDA
ncbi:MAG: type II toxin-antitoxin system RelB/DinJ family antitoxin [Treponema sp.]|nr:type II toxin-antitoxin system RelB/DinJ family antitoxin [Treponema sp.]